MPDATRNLDIYVKTVGDPSGAEKVRQELDRTKLAAQELEGLSVSPNLAGERARQETEALASRGTPEEFARYQEIMRGLGEETAKTDELFGKLRQNLVGTGLLFRHLGLSEHFFWNPYLAGIGALVALFKVWTNVIKESKEALTEKGKWEDFSGVMKAMRESVNDVVTSMADFDRELGKQKEQTELNVEATNKEIAAIEAKARAQEAISNAQKAYEKSLVDAREQSGELNRQDAAAARLAIDAKYEKLETQRKEQQQLDTIASRQKEFDTLEEGRIARAEKLRRAQEELQKAASPKEIEAQVSLAQSRAKAAQENLDRVNAAIRQHEEPTIGETLKNLGADIVTSGGAARVREKTFAGNLAERSSAEAAVKQANAVLADITKQAEPLKEHYKDLSANLDAAKKDALNGEKQMKEIADDILPGLVSSYRLWKSSVDQIAKIHEQTRTTQEAGTRSGEGLKEIGPMLKDLISAGAEKATAYGDINAAVEVMKTLPRELRENAAAQRAVLTGIEDLLGHVRAQTGDLNELAEKLKNMRPPGQ